ncbi:putative Ig domain-containing protein [Actinoplanes sp. NPDC049548]|uniref:putative Ig domain-containing protein n=1 Tax=Actinoplanes sp. NPDC049548 TaxID=3155152 RepID=UPI003436EAE0
MPTDRAVTPSPPGDEGMSLLEVMMAIFVIGTVMAAVAPVMVTSVALSNRQRSDQAGIQVANSAIERVRALEPTKLFKGRDKASSDIQWANAPKKVKDLLAQMMMVSDTSVTSGGSKAALPTEALEVTVNSTKYKQQWYVGQCWQTKVAATPTPAPTASATASTCAKTDPGNGVPFYRVVVSVEWQHAACPTGCLYVASTLVSYAQDPMFNTNPNPPKVGKLVAQWSYVNDDKVKYQITSSGGHLPLKWAASGLPDGLVIDPDSGEIHGTPTKTGTWTGATVEVTDKDGLSDDATFDWVIYNDLVVAPQAARSTRNNTAVNVPITATGGRPALTWTATGLPTGLTINSATGVITGTTAASGAVTYKTQITVTDAGTPRQVTVAFDWYVGPLVTPLTLANYSPPPVSKGSPVSYDLSQLAGGGLKPYTWSAVSLPDGLTMNTSTGMVTGTMQYASQYITTVTLADSSGQTKTIDITVEVTAGGNDMRINTPSGSPMSSQMGRAITSFPVDSAGSNPPSHTWSAVGLPPGVVISSDGAVTGTPTTRGKYRVTLQVTNNKADKAKLMFDWTIT